MIALKPSKGRLLVAEPSILNDKSFKRSIVLLTEHNTANSIGFIINKPLAFTIKDILPELNCSFKIYQGGPVEQENLYFIHKVPHLLPDSIEVIPGIYWGGDFDALTILIKDRKIEANDIRFFLGYSGWSQNQLHDELAQDSWLVIENNSLNILDEKTDTLWKEKLHEIGGKYKIWINAPTDPTLN